jgi:hypothetical protein
MYINPDLEVRLAHQRIEEALDVAKLDCLLKGARVTLGNNQRRFPGGLLSLPLLIIMAPFYWGVHLVRKI